MGGFTVSQKIRSLGISTLLGKPLRSLRLCLPNEISVALISSGR